MMRTHYVRTSTDRCSVPPVGKEMYEGLRNGCFFGCSQQSLQVVYVTVHPSIAHLQSHIHLKPTENSRVVERMAVIVSGGTGNLFAKFLTVQSFLNNILCADIILWEAACKILTLYRTTKVFLLQKIPTIR